MQRSCVCLLHAIFYLPVVPIVLRTLNIIDPQSGRKMKYSTMLIIITADIIIIIIILTISLSSSASSSSSSSWLHYSVPLAGTRQLRFPRQAASTRQAASVPA